MENSLDLEEIRQKYEREDEPLIDLLLSTPEREEPKLDVGVVCPICQGDTIQIIESSEGDSERTFFLCHCVNCGCDFVLAEDIIAACRRGIENAKREIEYNENKIKYFKQKLQGG